MPCFKGPAPESPGPIPAMPGSYRTTAGISTSARAPFFGAGRRDRPVSIYKDALDGGFLSLSGETDIR